MCNPGQKGQSPPVQCMTWHSVVGLVRSALDMSLSLGRAAAGVRGPLRAWRKKALQRIFESGDSLRLQFPLEDLGFCYNMPGAAVCLSQGASDSEASAQSAGSADSAAQNLRSQQGRGLEYVQITEPGSRLPHCDISILPGQRSSHGQALASLANASHEVISTHDLLDPSSASLLLIIGRGAAAAAWAAAAQELDRESRIFKVAQILDTTTPEEEVKAPAHLPIAVAEDLTGRWKTLREVSSRHCCSACIVTTQCRRGREDMAAPAMKCCA